MHYQEDSDDEQQLTHVNMPEIFNKAWKSVKEHFPETHVEKRPDDNTSSIVLHPIQGIDLIIEYCFKEKQGFSTLRVKSEKLSDTFVCELHKILSLKCTHLTEWQNLGDDIETVMQCIQVKREKRGPKKGKQSKHKRDYRVGKKSSMTTDYSFEDSFPEDEVSVSLEAVPGFSLDWNSYCKKEEKKPRPNYFIALRIHDKQIRDSIAEVQESLVRREDLLRKGVIPGDALHLTLCNLGLDSANDLLTAMEAMNQMKSQLQEALPKTPIVVQSISKFYNRAIYAKAKVHEDFYLFRNLLVENLQKAGVEFREDHETFNPHVTIIKVRRPERKAFGSRNIESSIYSDFVHIIHGEQKVDGLYLCAMGGQKREDGFYVTACELNFKLE